MMYERDLQPDLSKQEKNYYNWNNRDISSSLVLTKGWHDHSLETRHGRNKGCIIIFVFPSGGHDIDYHTYRLTRGGKTCAAWELDPNRMRVLAGEPCAYVNTRLFWTWLTDCSKIETVHREISSFPRCIQELQEAECIFPDTFPGWHPLSLCSLCTPHSWPLQSTHQSSLRLTPFLMIINRITLTYVSFLLLLCPAMTLSIPV